MFRPGYYERSKQRLPIKKISIKLTMNNEKLYQLVRISFHFRNFKFLQLSYHNCLQFIIYEFYKQINLAFRTKSPKYAHLTDEDVQKAEQAVVQSFQWLEQARSKLINAPKHLPPPITVQQIRQEKSNFENSFNPIVNKPAPKAPTPPKEEGGDKAQQNQQEPQQNQEQQQQNAQTEQSSQDQEKMEWSTT